MLLLLNFANHANAENHIFKTIQFMHKVCNDPDYKTNPIPRKSLRLQTQDAQIVSHFRYHSNPLTSDMAIVTTTCIS